MEGKISYVSMGQEVEGHQLIFNQLPIAARVSLKYKTKKASHWDFQRLACIFFESMLRNSV